jgi:protease I
MDLHGKHLALLVAPMFRDEEVFEPLDYFNAAGADVAVLALSRGRVFGKLGGAIEPDRLLSAVTPDVFDALILPGGQAPEVLRLEPSRARVRARLRRPQGDAGGDLPRPQILISADRLRGRRVTCYKGIRDDVKLAGALYEDAPVVVDGHLITSREPRDLPRFHDAIADALLKTVAAE